MMAGSHSYRAYRGRVILGFLVAILWMVSCQVQENPQSSTKPYLVLFAFSEEGKQLSTHMNVAQTDKQLGRGVLIGTVDGRPIVLAETGVGMTNAAMTTQRMIDAYHPRAIIFTGIAGAIDSTVHIGDIVVPGFWKEHDYGYYGANGFQPSNPTAYSPAVDSLSKDFAFAVDSVLLDKVRGLTHDSLGLLKIGDRTPLVKVGGVGVTGNSFIDSNEKRKWLSDQFNAEITDMESVGVAQVCTVNDLPFIIFRSASDLAGGSGSETAHNELDQFFKVAAANSSTVVVALLKQLDK